MSSELPTDQMREDAIATIRTELAKSESSRGKRLTMIQGMNYLRAVHA
jgi:hypothetical protein